MPVISVFSFLWLDVVYMYSKPCLTVLLTELRGHVMNIECVIHFQKMVKWPQKLTVMMIQMILQRNYVCIYFR